MNPIRSASNIMPSTMNRVPVQKSHTISLITTGTRSMAPTNPSTTNNISKISSNMVIHVFLWSDINIIYRRAEGFFLRVPHPTNCQSIFLYTLYIAITVPNPRQVEFFCKFFYLSKVAGTVETILQNDF